MNSPADVLGNNQKVVLTTIRGLEDFRTSFRTTGGSQEPSFVDRLYQFLAGVEEGEVRRGRAPQLQVENDLRTLLNQRIDILLIDSLDTRGKNKLGLLRQFNELAGSAQL